MSEHQDISKQSGLNVNTYRLVSYGLVASMLACAALTVVALIDRMILTWQPSYLSALCFIVALDRLYTYRLFRDWMSFSREWLARFGAQVIIILVFTKAMVGLSHGWNAFLAEIPLWPQNLSTYFFNGETVFALSMALIAWLLSGNFAALLEEIGPEHIQSAGLDGVPENNIPARKRLVSLFFSLGTVLVVLATISRIDLHSVFDRQTFSFIEIPALAAGGASTLLYFMLGLALFSQTQFISLHVRWTVQQIPVNGSLAKQWAGYSLLFLGLVALLAGLLPTSYVLQPLQALAYLLNAILTIYLAVGQAILAFFLYILGLLYSLFGKAPPAQNAPGAPLSMPKLPPNAGSSVGPNWLEIIKALIFWAIFAGILFFAARQYLEQHHEILKKLRELPGWKLLAQVWGWLKNLLTRAQSGVAGLVAAGRERILQLTARPGLGGGFMNLRKLDPRQRIYFFYLALIRRGGEKGLPRSLSQTPDEYAAALQAALPAAGEDIRALTQAFVDARYSRQPVQPE
ncbi:MAG: DUF4129 domain-containing protein, partial [Anaerolineales bacterium]